MLREIAISVAVAASTAGVVAYMRWRRRRVVRWRWVGTLKEICISPLKSGLQMEHDEAECEYAGLTGSGTVSKRLRDRCFVIMDTPRSYISGRDNPLVARIKCHIDDNTATFSSRLEPLPSLVLNLDQLEAMETTDVHFGWGDNAKRWVKVVDCGNEGIEWLKSCNITRSKSTEKDSIEWDPPVPHLMYFKDILDNHDQRGLLFCEDTAYTVITQKSLDELNRALCFPCASTSNFRTNFVIGGTEEPFEEENWKLMRIGTAVFKYVKPCFRFPYATLHHQTGQRMEYIEPLKTLKRYRQFKDPAKRLAAGDAPVFGANFGLISGSGSIIHTRDHVFVCN